MQEPENYRTDQKQNTLNVLFKRGPSALTFIFSTALFLLVSFVFSFEFERIQHVLMLILALVSFTSFDALGYKQMIQAQYIGEPTAAYRIIQTMYQHILGVICFWADPFVAVFYYFTWLSGFCDALYYFLTNEIEFLFTYDGEWFWLYWTLPGNVSKIIPFKVNGAIIFVTGTSALILSCLLLIFI